MTTETIDEFLKNHSARLSYDYRWLIWDDYWVVCSKRPSERVSRVVYNDLDLALQALITGVR